MNQKSENKFTDTNIRKIFGSYDGEGENITRLTEYFLKTDVFDSITSDLPVRILVGSKGVGKSALFRVAIKEAKEAKTTAILIKPDDIAEIGETHESLVLSIRKWKYGLIRIIVRKFLDEFDFFDASIVDTLAVDSVRVGGKVRSAIRNFISQYEVSQAIPDDIKAKIEDVLQHQKIEIYLDDLDRGWQNRKEGLIMISALINSIRDLSSENEDLFFKVALRTDVYYAVRTADESSDKFEGEVVYYTFTLHEIFVLLIKRILTFEGKQVNDETLLRTEQRHLAFHMDSIFEKKFAGKGAWENAYMSKVLLSLIRNRPRDLVKLCTLAAKEAYRNRDSLIGAKHILTILPDYSRNLIADTIAEYKSELPTIERLIYGMKPDKIKKSAAEIYLYTTPDLRTKLFKLKQHGDFKFASNDVATPQELISFLYKIGFLTARKRNDDNIIIRKSYEEYYSLAMTTVDFGYDWEVHMGYRWAIQPETLNDLFSRL
ncbi:MAG: hypothetical protein BGO69_17030 [Bacteroidetes bacterium 46-16]|nr:MAG: hypothetical protein BGO69_17030 [Bacteroidetes bacterium 46-16]